MSNTERAELIDVLARHRELLLRPAEGLTDEQARTASSASALTIASILKHVADTEQEWMQFAARGAEAFGESEVYDADVDWDEVDRAAENGEWAGEDPRFALDDTDTLDHLRTRLQEVAQVTEEILRTADLNLAHPLPEAPWFEPDTRWSVRRVALHMIAEISQHAGHADIIRESIDGSKSMG